MDIYFWNPFSLLVVMSGLAIAGYYLYRYSKRQEIQKNYWLRTATYSASVSFITFGGWWIYVMIIYYISTFIKQYPF